MQVWGMVARWQKVLVRVRDFGVKVPFLYFPTSKDLM